MRRILVFASALFNIYTPDLSLPASATKESCGEVSCVALMCGNPEQSLMLQISKRGVSGCIGQNLDKVISDLVSVMRDVVKGRAAVVPGDGDDWIARAKRLVLKRDIELRVIVKKKFPIAITKKILRLRGVEELLEKGLPEVLDLEKVAENEVGRAIGRLLAARTKEEALNAVDAMEGVVSIPEGSMIAHLPALYQISSLRSLRNLVEQSSDEYYRCNHDVFWNYFALVSGLIPGLPKVKLPENWRGDESGDCMHSGIKVEFAPENDPFAFDDWVIISPRVSLRANLEA